MTKKIVGTGFGCCFSSEILSGTVTKNPKSKFQGKKLMRWPRIELGSTAWKAAMLTIIPPTLDGEGCLV